MDTEAVLKRIKALMAKTVESGCTEEEATSAAMKAQELIDKYNVEHLLNRKVDEDGLGYKVYKHYVEAKYADSWRLRVLGAVARNAGLFGYRQVRGITDKDKKLLLCGREETVLAVVEIITHIIKYVEAARPPAGLLGDKNTVRRQYQRGMATRICARISESRNLAEHPNLPQLLEGETKKIESDLETQLGKFKKTAASFKVDGAFAQGYHDGSNVPLRARSGELA